MVQTAKRIKAEQESVHKRINTITNYKMSI